MEFDVTRVYTALNADELKVGSKVIIADTLGQLKNLVSMGDNRNINKLVVVHDELEEYRFKVDNGFTYALAYLVEEPSKLKWTDLKVGDALTNDGKTSLVVIIDSVSSPHVLVGCTWITDEELTQWRKVEDD